MNAGTLQVTSPSAGGVSSDLYLSLSPPPPASSPSARDMPVITHKNDRTPRISRQTEQGWQHANGRCRPPNRNLISLREQVIDRIDDQTDHAGELNRIANGDRHGRFITGRECRLVEQCRRGVPDAAHSGGLVEKPAASSACPPDRRDPLRSETRAYCVTDGILLRMSGVVPELLGRTLDQP